MSKDLVARHANDLVDYAVRKASAVTAEARMIAQKSVSQSIASGAPNTPIIGWDEIADTGSNFNPTTGVFTVPADGFYQVNAAILTNGVVTNGEIFLAILLNGATQLQGIATTPTTGGATGNLSVTVAGTVKASKNDLIVIGFTQFTGSPITTFASGVDNFFTVAQLP